MDKYVRKLEERVKALEEAAAPPPVEEIEAEPPPPEPEAEAEEPV